MVAAKRSKSPAVVEALLKGKANVEAKDKVRDVGGCVSLPFYPNPLTLLPIALNQKQPVTITLTVTLILALTLNLNLTLASNPKSNVHPKP